MKKKLITLALALILISALLPTARAASSYITNPAKLRGSDYTDIPALAASLDTVFAGKPALYSDAACSSGVTASPGSRAVPPGRTMFVRDPDGNVYSGTSCYIYANAVYATLFGDIPFHGEPGSWRYSTRVIKNAPSAGFNLFSSAGVSCGALLRTTANYDGSYNSSLGHSVIILKYDAGSVTYLEGNGDGKGLIRVTTRDWDTFNSTSVSGRGYRICFVVQPNKAVYASLRSGSAPGRSDLVGYFKRGSAPAFRDVSPASWYFSGVTAACELGLTEGRGGGCFDPEGTITVAEAVTVAARFLSRYYDDRYDFSGSGRWYEPYYDYCALWGIDTSFAAPGAAITRADFAYLMDLALPKAARTDASCPVYSDVPEDAAWARPIYALSRTGVLRGSDGAFRPNATLTRAEAACVLSRMADRALR